MILRSHKSSLEGLSNLHSLATIGRTQKAIRLAFPLLNPPDSLTLSRIRWGREGAIEGYEARSAFTPFHPLQVQSLPNQMGQAPVNGVRIISTCAKSVFFWGVSLGGTEVVSTKKGAPSKEWVA